jgi:SAM-dependent methyltransferase
MMQLLRRVNQRLRPNRHAVSSHSSYIRAIRGKAGLEIGGPSAVLKAGGPLPLYDHIGSLDNCDFSASTTWAEHATEFIFSPHKPAGKNIFCDGSQLTPVADACYDFVFSSHNLEHFANPAKALLEWKRVMRPGGALVLILPFYQRTFDHRRIPTSVAHMMDDLQNNTAEDDLTHLPEILERHDLERDPPAGSLDNFRRRSLDNFNNRCLHHHVFDDRNSRELLEALGFKVLTVDIDQSINLCLLAQT